VPRFAKVRVRLCSRLNKCGSSSKYGPRRGRLDLWESISQLLGLARHDVTRPLESSSVWLRTSSHRELDSQKSLRCIDCGKLGHLLLGVVVEYHILDRRTSSSELKLGKDMCVSVREGVLAASGQLHLYRNMRSSIKGSLPCKANSWLVFRQLVNLANFADVLVFTADLPLKNGTVRAADWVTLYFV
jgi:hypothetical protein